MPDHPLKTIRTLDPELSRRVAADDEFAFAEGAIPRKIKLLIGMAFDASHGAVGGVRGLASRAMEAGASKQEIIEVLRIAYLFGGVGSVYIGSQGLEDLFNTRLEELQP